MNINSVVQRAVVTTERHNTVVLDNLEIRELLKRIGYQVPATAQIYFTVPGGGDWSNTTVDITKENPITIEWTDVTHQEQPLHAVGQPQRAR